MTSRDKEAILAQWQTCVEMANAVSQRRDSLNNLFVTLNLAIIAANSSVLDGMSILLCIVGMIECIVWVMFIRNFKALNEAKFEVINELEKELPAHPFNDEWAAVKRSRKYKEGTCLEVVLPITFIVAYAISLALICI